MNIGSLHIPGIPIILAPMEDVTDPPFRHYCKYYGADLMYTEFVSSEGLIRYAGKSLEKLDFSEDERPIGIQIFGNDADSMRRAVGIAESANPDLIDINFGCPVKKVVVKGGGAALLRNPQKMADLTRAVVESTKLPVTVKTRLGWDDSSKNIVEVAERLQDVGIQAISIHARTRAQLYKGRADWTLIGEVKNNPRINIPVIGNGDIDTPEKAKQMIQMYGVDGIMIGRAAIGNPFIFREVKGYLDKGAHLPPASLNERIDVCKGQLRRSVEWKSEKTAIYEMRKHYAAYFHGLPHFKPFKIRLVSLDEASALYEMFDEISAFYSDR